MTPDGRRVIGVRVRDRSGQEPEWTVQADLVVDCAGRRSPVSGWLEQFGYAAPQAERLTVDVGYATRHYRLPAGTLGGDGLVTIGPTPDGSRGGVLPGIEDNRWMTILFGLCGGRPPLDPAAFDAFAQGLPFPVLHEALQLKEPLDEPAGFRFPATPCAASTPSTARA